MKRNCSWCFFLLLVFIITGCGDSQRISPNSSYYEPQPPKIDKFIVQDLVPYVFSDLPIFRLLRFLKLVNSAHAAITPHNNAFIFKAENNLTGEVENLSNPDRVLYKSPAGESLISFSPNDFIVENDLWVGDNHALQNFENELLNDYHECTSFVLSTGESNYVKKLEMRIDCLKTKGHKPINIAYMRIKYEKY